MRSRRKAQDQETGRGIAERGHWFAPVLPIPVRFTPDGRDLLAMTHQPGTPRAPDDRAIQFE
jgi:hypothetical protein